MASEKSKVLVIGGTGYIGKFVVQESAKSGHQTFALVREASLADPVKAKVVQNFKDLGVTILHGDLNDHESLVKAIKQVDVVISTVGSLQISDQTKIISAIKEAGNVKRFFPSEFGTDVERTSAVEPAKSTFFGKVEIRKAIEAEGIPYTYIVSNCFAGYYLPTLVQFEPGLTSPPMNEMVTLWEKKIGKSLEKIHISEEQVLKSIIESPIPFNILLSINHSVFVNGDQTNFTIEPSFGLKASELYPDVKYTSIEEYLSHFA